MSETARLLEQLIEIPSVNPLLPGSTGLPDERNLAVRVADHLHAAGIEFELQEVTDGRCNVIGHLPRRGTADDAVVLLTAHMDTYPAKGPQSDYRAIREDGAIYGRGSADAKGSLAAMLTAFVEAATSPDRREAYLAATVDEECLLLGARKLADHGMRPTLGITGEPTSLVPITAQKGIVRGSLRVCGEMAHAAYPTARTAIGDSVQLVDAVARLNAAYADEATHPALGAPTVTITRVESDGGMNLAARQVTVYFDARFLPGTDGAAFTASLVKRLRDLVPQIGFDLERVTFVSPPNELGPPDGLVAEFFAAVKEAVGQCEPDSFAYGSEAGVLAEFCDSALVFGPGDARYSHAEVEVIDTDELRTASRIFHSILVGRT